MVGVTVLEGFRQRSTVPVCCGHLLLLLLLWLLLFWCVFVFVCVCLCRRVFVPQLSITDYQYRTLFVGSGTLFG